MKVKSVWPTVASLGISFFVLTACGANRTASPSAAASERLAGTVPPSLVTMEGVAEDAYDQALAGSFGRVAVNARSIESKWTAFRSQALADGATVSDAERLDAAVRGLIAAATQPQGIVRVGRAANAVSASMENLFAVYRPAVPPVLMTLDYLGREIALDGMEGTFSMASMHESTLSTRWETVRAAVIEKGGTSEAEAFDRALASVTAAISASDAAAVTNRANVVLDQVDLVEALFEGRALRQ